MPYIFKYRLSVINRITASHAFLLIYGKIKKALDIIHKGVYTPIREVKTCYEQKA